jgi:hypothetical protein
MRFWALSLGGVLVLSTLAVFNMTGCGNSNAVGTASSSNAHSVSNASGTYNYLEAANGYDIRSTHLHHPTAYITQMCYTKTKASDGRLHNPCFACHIDSKTPNYVDDGDLQEAYDFVEVQAALHNPFKNDFLDFSAEVAKLSDDAIIGYVDTDNYFDANGSIILADTLNRLPDAWDADGDGKWGGYVPDCHYHFNAEGFDTAPDGTPTGWTAFAYMPFLGTFWPTNGSTDDVLIRLGEPFRSAEKSGEFNATIYKTNLAIVEAVVKEKTVPIAPTDETALGVDLNKNGVLDTAERIVYDWAPNAGRMMSYVGYAKALQERGELHLAGGLYPEQTEFLHSVRYIKSDREGDIDIAPRMKELRYAKKTLWLTYANLRNKAMAEMQEKDLDPDKIETFRGTMESGLGTNTGWVYQGFIEDKNGNLRPQSYEETLNCMGCHSGIGATTDTTFAFPRKLDDDFQYGWYHWTQKSLKGTPENRYIDGTWELTHYLKLNNSGDEFRANGEVKRKFFTAEGDLNQTMVQRLHTDVTQLLFPSHTRALMLNKAYRALVKTQKFYDGKAGHITPMHNVYKEVNASQPTGLIRYIMPR